MFKALENKITHASLQQGPVRLLSFDTLLRAASYGYRAGAVLRNHWYESGRFVRKKLPCPVISIGNIMAGGTGKTPAAVYLADLLIRMGKHPVVISRGYKGDLKKKAAVVGDGAHLFLDVCQAGDEPYMMAALKRFPVVVGKDRYRAGCLALDRLPVDVVILDDGFQHIRLERDLDIVLLDHDAPLGNGRILPAGRLREPAVPALARAHAVILTRCPEMVLQGPHWVSTVAPDLPLFYSRHRPFPVAMVPAGPNPKHRAVSGAGPGYMSFRDGLKGISVVLFSGIADNTAFYKTIEKLGANILDHLEFQDHYRYKRSDILQIQRQANALKADMVATTHKDWVKLDQTMTWPVDLVVTGVTVSLDNESGFIRLVKTGIQP
jgi:tetraacyldisaccharide 4'-kinase